MRDRYDVVIVGARCAGSPLATLLAQAGMSVCLVDRAGFPSDTPSTHGIQPTGVKILRRLGVLDRLLQLAPGIERGTARLDDVRFEIDEVSRRLGAPMLFVRRITLDAILLDAAAQAGVEIRTKTAVSGLIEEGGRVVGVRTADGDIRASLVVGADGTRSTVARLVGAADYHCTAPGRAFLWGYFESAEADLDRVWLGKVDDLGYLAGHTDAGQFMAAVVVSMDRREELRGDRERGYTEALREWPELHDAMGAARRVGPVRMMSRWHGFFRESAGPGWVLVGDAGHFKDPSPGQGISDALRQSVELAGAIERGGDQALRDWWAWRDRDAWDMYWFAHDMGAPGPTPLVIREMQRRIAADPAKSDRFLRVLNHDLAPSEAFTTGLALGAIGRAVRVHPGQRRMVLGEARALLGAEVRRAIAGRALRRGEYRPARQAAATGPRPGVAGPGFAS